MDIAGFDSKDFLPYYLTEEQKSGLAKALKDYSALSNIFTQQFQDEILQGDCWEGIPHITHSGRRDNIQGIILSNSCDIDTNNVRHTPVHITYAPLLNLSAYIEILKRQLSPAEVDDKVSAVRSQRITNIMYLPASVSNTVDSIAVLDMASSIPYKIFEAEAARRKVRSLNQLGLYLLSFKLSIHFCRMHEGLQRG